MWKCPKCGREFKNQEQGHYCLKPNNIDEYIAFQDELTRPYLQAVREAIRRAVPEAQERISWSMPTFWDGRNVIQFAASKKHLGLYPGPEAVKEFQDRLADYETSKGTIRLPYREPVPLELIADIAKWCWEQYKC
ncbi:MAG: DUF1801 domain-containing protein [Oscillospiraceae bacterium]